MTGIGFIKQRMIKALILVVNTDAILSKNLELRVGSRSRFRRNCRETGDFGRDCGACRFIHGNRNKFRENVAITKGRAAP